ncbi:protein HEXIM-like [Limulus polyphemus]|uniref:Protein HEXIM-like n=1 Tax=Limulus polyphemus TaxID=6850 RepID=A0ABM1BSK2_LIMPO|nr:protein HEXIM-like [Limulus polyphemus]
MCKSHKKSPRKIQAKKEKWKPYNKLSWKEKLELEERETRRANRIRAELVAHGLPLAPYNTTQFLMDDHYVQEPNFEVIYNGHRNSHHDYSGDSDEFYSSPEDEDVFLQKQFSEVYDDIHAERLNSMSKNELVREYMQLEDRIEELELQLKDAKAESISSETVCDGEAQTSEFNEREQLEKIRIFREEIKQLAEENVLLRKENERMMKIAGGISIS